MFLDLIRKESKVTLIEFDKNCHNNKTDEMVNSTFPPNTLDIYSIQHNSTTEPLQRYTRMI